VAAAVARSRIVRWWGHCGAYIRCCRGPTTATAQDWTVRECSSPSAEFYRDPRPLTVGSTSVVKRTGESGVRDGRSARLSPFTILLPAHHAPPTRRTANRDRSRRRSLDGAGIVGLIARGPGQQLDGVPSARDTRRVRRQRVPPSVQQAGQPLRPVGGGATERPRRPDAGTRRSGRRGPRRGPVRGRRSPRRYPQNHACGAV
jgi:hypothetical protein